jgi:hypothetical protein
MQLDIHPAQRVSVIPSPAPDVDILDAAVGLEMRGLVDETTQERFGRDVFEIARERVVVGLSPNTEPSPWSTAQYHGWQGWAERSLPGLDRFARGFLFGAGTLFVFLLLWFSDLSQRITPAGGIVVAASTYLASAGWSRLMSVSAGEVVHYSRVEADRQLIRYVTRAAATLAVLAGLMAVGYAVTGTLEGTLGPGSVVVASIANLTLFWLILAFAAAQRRPWLILLFAVGGLLGLTVARAVVEPSWGMHTQLALAGFNLAGVLYMASRAVLAYRPRHAFLERSGAAPLPARRRRYLAGLGIGYGFLILSDFIVLAAVGYFATTSHGSDIYLVLKLVAIIPLVISLGVMEVLEYRLGETIRRHEERLASSDPGFTTVIRRAFYTSLLSFGAWHTAAALIAATLVLPGMPLRHFVAESALTADIIVPGLLATLGTMFALAGMFCATLLSTMGDDETILKWLLAGLALSLVVGGSLYPALGIVGAATGFAAGTGAFLVLGVRAVVERMIDHSLLSYRQAIG